MMNQPRQRYSGPPRLDLVAHIREQLRDPERYARGKTLATAELILERLEQGPYACPDPYGEAR